MRRLAEVSSVAVDAGPRGNARLDKRRMPIWDLTPMLIRRANSLTSIFVAMSLFYSFCVYLMRHTDTPILFAPTWTHLYNLNCAHIDATDT